jgi:hypothetical protein
VKTADERGPFGAWLVEQRKRLAAERGQPLRQQDLVAELAAFGYPIEESYYRALEGGSKLPGRDLREHLGRFFGVTPPDSRPKGDPTEIAAAIREQTAALYAQAEAISGLAQRLELMAAAQQGVTEGMAGAVLELVALLQPGARRDASQQPPSGGAHP